MKELHCIVSGRVQMVMYRDFATRKARRLGLVGWVKNLSDGTVEVVAQGPQAQLEKYLEYLRKGSIFARVDEVHTRWCESKEVFSNFSIAW